MSVFGSSGSAKQSPCDCAQLAHLKCAYLRCKYVQAPSVPLPPAGACRLHSPPTPETYPCPALPAPRCPLSSMPPPNYHTTYYAACFPHARHVPRPTRPCCPGGGGRAARHAHAPCVFRYMWPPRLLADRASRPRVCHVCARLGGGGREARHSCLTPTHAAPSGLTLVPCRAPRVCHVSARPGGGGRAARHAHAPCVFCCTYTCHAPRVCHVYLCPPRLRWTCSPTRPCTR